MSTLETLAPKTAALIRDGEFDDFTLTTGDTERANALLDSLEDDLDDAPEGAFRFYEVLNRHGRGTHGWQVGVLAPATYLHVGMLLPLTDHLDVDGQQGAREFVQAALDRYETCVAECAACR